MDNNYYEKQFPVILEMTEKSAEKQYAFFQHILLVSSSILGILISLHTTSSSAQYVRYLFALSLVLLSLCILSTVIVVYDHSQLVERGRQAFVKEVQSALQDNRKVNMVTVAHKKRTLFLEKCSYVLLPLSLLMLTVYGIFIAI